MQQSLKDIIFSIMINEDFNRPFMFRKIEKILCKVSGKPYTQGIMQVSSPIPLSDEESIKLAIHKIFEDAYNYFLEETDYLQESPLVIYIGRNYNPCDDYISAVEDIYNITLYTTNFIGPLSYQAFSFLKLRALS
ncbi:hypothetical protein [Acinetobacter haemolyticus]|uniref:hypothetical protein n=2 Tax=Acinetobacter haemolyticus TaxID=29430 RepID=UPI0011C044AE|nr:hypothetical protein [Acinetobacter haemolyticus]NAR68660.1 hypothetical protein [Acinetobacter haemolyticus]NAR94275.1 hypothetical protein [Acinetobacter haemolyticus]